MTLNQKLPDKLRIFIKIRGKIRISHVLNRKLPGNGSKSDRLRRELPGLAVAQYAFLLQDDAHWCTIAPTI